MKPLYHWLQKYCGYLKCNNAVNELPDKMHRKKWSRTWLQGQENKSMATKAASLNNNNNKKNKPITQ